MKNYRALCILFLLFLFLFLFSNVNAQEKHHPVLNGKGLITGIVLDADNSSPLPGANAILYSARDSSMITGEVTDKKGKFQFEKIPSGKYYIKVNFVGYSSELVDRILINDANQAVNLGTVKMSAQALSQGEIEVTGRKEAAVYAVDKKVFNVERNITAAGGTALDVMQTIPAVSVDIDGNVNLRGSTNIKILVDGKPSSLAGSTILDQIPASAIERVEVITNPSAKYEAEGQTGIINIVLKKKSAEGFNGLMSFNAGTQDKYNASINTNYRIGMFNFFANYDNRYFRMSGIGSLNRSYNGLDISNNISQANDFSMNGYNHNFKAGADVFLGKSNSISLSGLFNFGTRKHGDIMRSNSAEHLYQSGDSSLTGFYKRESIEANDRNGTELTFGYKHNFGDKMHDLTVDIFYSKSSGNEDNDIETLYLDQIGVPLSNILPDQSRSFTDQPNRTITVQSDYLLPFDKDTKLEAGYKSSFRRLDQDYRYENFLDSTQTWAYDNIKSNSFLYDEAVHALYLSYTGNIGSFKYQAGVRSEWTITNTSQQVTNENHRSSYINFFPSIFLKEEFSQSNSINLNYSRRIRRPGNWELNPFIDYSDPQNLRSGNPNLKPEYVNSFELGHSLFFGKTTFMTTLFDRYTEQMISRIIGFYNNDTTVSITTPQNMSSSNSYGLEFIATHEFLKGWRADASFSYFKTTIKGSYSGNDYNNNDFSWTGKMNNYISLFGLADLQLTMYYQAPIVTPQGRMLEQFSTDLGLKAEFMEGNLAVNFRLSDIFNTQKFDVAGNVTSAVNGHNVSYNYDFYRKRISRVAFLGFTYKFNNYMRSPSERKRRPEDNGGGDEGY